VSPASKMALMPGETERGRAPIARTGIGLFGSAAILLLLGCQGADVPTAPALQAGSPPPPPTGDLPAFPGAQGYGAIALQQVDRGDLQVLFVTNLEWDGPGSLRDAVARIDNARFSVIIFRVGGTINVGQLDFGRNGRKRNFYIAGQTAPGDGIQLYCAGCAALIGSPEDAVIRYIRVRSDKGEPGTQDVISLGKGSRRVIFDHVSTEFGNDEVFSISAGRRPGSPIGDITIQRSIIAAGLRPHSTGSLFVGSDRAGPPFDRLTLHHNLWVHNAHRNPLFKGPREVQLINNVVYNWKNTGSQIFGTTEVDMLNNYYRAGPWSYLPRRAAQADPEARIHASGNIADPYQMDPAADQTNIILQRANRDPISRDILVSRAFSNPSIPVVLQSAVEAYSSVVNDVGANARLTCRGGWVSNSDALDSRLLRQVRDRTGPASADENDDPADHGGVPTSRGGTPCMDSDSDGMPDEFEARYGLDPDDPSDAARDDDGDGYINLEEYLNGTRPRG